MSIIFLDLREEINEFFAKEKLDISPRFFNEILKLISKIPNYEEEEIKVKPQLLLGKQSVELLKTLSQKYILPIFKDDLEGSYFEKKMKSLIPFCNLGWFVYIDLEEDGLSYGLVRSFTGPQGLTLIEEMNSVGDLIDEGLIFIETNNKTGVSFKGLKAQELVIDFKLFDDPDFRLQNNAITNLSEDIVSGLANEDDKKTLLKVFNKLIGMAQPKIHGTILLVVDKDVNKLCIPDILKDGTWLEEVIDISNSALETVNTKETLLSERHYSLTGLFIQMLNFDGITIINSLGQVLAYNVFLKQSQIDEIGAVGGARRRTAMSLCKITDINILGVYFQSQDSHFTYERIEKNE